MNDDVKAAYSEDLETLTVEWFRWSAKNGGGWRHRDAVLVFDRLLAHREELRDIIDGEAARMAAAVAAAREEQREADAKFCPNCLGVGFVERPVPCPYCDDSTHDHYCPTGTQRQQCGCGAERIRATPLTATPLADELERNWQETARMVERAEKAEAERDALKVAAEANLAVAEKCSRAIDLVCDERDALRAQVSELEECKQEGDDVEVAAQRLRFWAENPYACPVHFGARTACGQCYDSERALRRSTEAQVEAARAECENTKCGADCDSATCSDSECHVARRMWRAMDGAKPK